MTLWCDRSAEARELAKRLREKGHVVKEILTANPNPTVCGDSGYVFGYQNIFFRYDLL